MNEPLVSVILPVYNGEEYLQEAIDSILQQTYKNIEFIIINDGSTDKTDEIVNKYKHEPKLIYINRNNKGLVYSLNEGISLASGFYIARMDADDIAFPSRISKQVEYFEKYNDIAVLGSRVECIDENGQYVKCCRRPLSDVNIYTHFIYGTPLAHPSVMFNMKIIQKIDLKYLSDAYPAEDLDLWMRLSEKYKLNNIKEPLLKYRINTKGVSGNNRTFQKKKSKDLRCSFFIKNKRAVEFIDFIDSSSRISVGFVFFLLAKSVPLLFGSRLSGLYMFNIVLRVLMRNGRKS